MSAPTSDRTIQTERLILAPHGLADFAESAAMWSDADVTRHIGGRPFTQEEAWTRHLRAVGHWTLLDYGYWAVRDRATGAFVGEVGFSDFKREIEPSYHGVPEMGWVLNPAFHGRGYATEAVSAGLAWADALLGKRFTCIINPDNKPSIRVAEGQGFKLLTPTTYKGVETLLFERRT